MFVREEEVGGVEILPGGECIMRGRIREHIIPEPSVRGRDGNQSSNRKHTHIVMIIN